VAACCMSMDTARNNDKVTVHTSGSCSTAEIQRRSPATTQHSTDTYIHTRLHNPPGRPVEQACPQCYAHKCHSQHQPGGGTTAPPHTPLATTKKANSPAWWPTPLIRPHLQAPIMTGPVDECRAPPWHQLPFTAQHADLRHGHGCTWITNWRHGRASCTPTQNLHSECV